MWTQAVQLWRAGGRFSRRAFLVQFALAFAGLALVDVLAGRGVLGANWAAFALAAPFAYLAWTAAVKRLHDTGRSGLWTLLALAPAVLAYLVAWVAGMGGAGSATIAQLSAWTLGLGVAVVCLAAVVVLGLTPGSAGYNGYGPPPGRTGARRRAAA